MPMLYMDGLASATEVVAVEEAEEMLSWFQAHPGARVDLTACTHLHAAALQVLMAAQPAVTGWPANEGLAAWLMSALPQLAHATTTEQ